MNTKTKNMFRRTAGWMLVVLSIYIFVASFVGWGHPEYTIAEAIYVGAPLLIAGALSAFGFVIGIMMTN